LSSKLQTPLDSLKTTLEKSENSNHLSKRDSTINQMESKSKSTDLNKRVSALHQWLNQSKLNSSTKSQSDLAVSAVIKMAVDKDKAKGCEVIISGKLSQQRAKSMKFKKGYMISSGQAKKDYLETAIRHVILKQGVMGVKVKIMK
jgi:hypothetical protein